MEYELPRRPHTVGSAPKYVHSDLIMNLIQEIEQEATCSVTKPNPPRKNYFKENLKRLKEIQAKAKEKITENQPLQPIKVPSKYTLASEYRRTPQLKSVDTNVLPRTANSCRVQPPRSPCLSSKSDNHRLLQPSTSLPQLNNIEADEHVSKYCDKYETKNQENYTTSEKSLHSLACSKSKNSTDSKSESKRRLGRIPNYLTERKKQWEIEKERQLKMMEEASIPPGHTLLPDEERIETLELLKKNQEELMQSLAALPVRNDTVRLRNYKEDLERQLAKVEEGIKIFSRPKVLIKNDT